VNVIRNNIPIKTNKTYAKKEAFNPAFPLPICGFVLVGWLDFLLDRAPEIEPH
jgi:hypothetical protein